MKKIKPLNKSELANYYGVSRKTLMRWLTPHEKKIGKYTGKCYTIRQLKIIFKILGK